MGIDDAPTRRSARRARAATSYANDADDASSTTVPSTIAQTVPSKAYARCPRYSPPLAIVYTATPSRIDCAYSGAASSAAVSSAAAAASMTAIESVRDIGDEGMPHAHVRTRAAPSNTAPATGPGSDSPVTLRLSPKASSRVSPVSSCTRCTERRSSHAGRAVMSGVGEVVTLGEFGSEADGGAGGADDDAASASSGAGDGAQALTASATARTARPGASRRNMRRR